MTASDRPAPGTATPLEPGLRRILAPNPSPMTYWGTNTYLIGTGGGIAVVDPGPDDPAHLAAIQAALEPGEHISHILVTHSHADHVAACPALARAYGAPVLGFGDNAAGRRADLAALDGLGGGEGRVPGFATDQRLADGDRIHGDGWSLTALWTPGHLGNHLCFAFGDALLSGDHVMGWASSLVSPPDGDIAQFMASLKKLMGRGDRVFYPGHGAPVPGPESRLQELWDHRRMREAQILDALQQAPGSADTLARRIYTDVPPALLPAATRNVLAHLIDLTDRNQVTCTKPLTATSLFSRH